MTTLDKKRIKIEGNESWLQNLQANILKSHGRNNLKLLLLQFNKERIPEVKDMIASLPITSALEQAKQTARFKAVPKNKRDSIIPETVTNLYLTNEGYKTLGVIYEKKDAFKQGLAHRLNDEGDEHLLGDIPSEWEFPYQEELHAMLMIANDDINIIRQLVSGYEEQFLGKIHIVGRQSGLKITNEFGKPIEHFGYADGVSQPLFFEDEIQNTPKTHWNPDAPLSLVLTKDFGTDTKGCYGSYLVYRKLEQNVKAFKAAEEDLAKKLEFTGTAEEAAGAMVIGRFEPGLPAIKFGSTASPESSSTDNDFDYSFDKEGARCPFHAHIRKVNPRGDNGRFFGISDEEERSHRIVRRGITYGRRILDKNGHGTGKDYPEGEVGLLFMCFQSNIEKQFEFIQGTWANNNDFPVPFTGIDPVIGQGQNRKAANGTDIEQQWHKSDGSKCPHSLSGFVTMKGGGYFFAPSLVFIQSLVTKTII